LKEKSIFDELSEERKALQVSGDLPDWFTTQGWQMFKEKYLYEAKGLKDTYQRIAKTAARHTDDPVEWEGAFFEILWNGWLACSTPVLANMGTTRGCPVSCSGSYVGDSVYDFYETQKEIAMLSKNGFGTSAYLGDIRPRGSVISKGGKASGVLPVLKDIIQVSRDVSQGSSRRGAVASYLEIEHGDFYEVVNFLLNNPDDCNIGWNISDNFIERLKSGDQEALERYQRALKVKCITGKGYFFFTDKTHRQQPKMYHDLGLRCKASQLCTEITLMSDQDHTYTCVLSSLNLSKYDEWKNTDAVFVATVFLDCVASEFIEQAKEIQGLERAVRFTEKSRALGLGALGFHTYIQDKGWLIDGVQTEKWNKEVFSFIKEEALKASNWMADAWGEPEWCKGYGVRNTHLLAIAPNTTSALVCGGVSQGIEPVYKNAYVQGSSAGELNRINPALLKLLKLKGVDVGKAVQQIIDDKGTVKNLDCLTPDEKMIFRTAFEVDQKVLLRLASDRHPDIDQAQSLNLFFSSDEDESYISEVFQQAFEDEKIKSVYYLRSESGVSASKGGICESCEG
jgi:ribonucleoside-diphosphate reductase alpha chain